MGILGPPYCGIGATIRIGREMLCLPYAGFLLSRLHSSVLLQFLSTFISVDYTVVYFCSFFSSFILVDFTVVYLCMFCEHSFHLRRLYSSVNSFQYTARRCIAAVSVHCLKHTWRRCPIGRKLQSKVTD